MYINPETNIRILTGVPLDNTYVNTLSFTDVNAQAAYFIGKTKYNLENYTYQRVNIGVARIGLKADLLYDCNYMMFRNTAYGTKWFYAFVTSVEYVNDNMSNINFEIDVMQTWLFDVKLNQCFVEREHSSTDAIGDSLTPEPCYTGEYVFNSYQELTPGLNNFGTIVAVVDTDGESSGRLYDGVYGGADLYYYAPGDSDMVTAKINEYVQKPDAIVAIYVVPASLLRSASSGSIIPSGATANTNTVALSQVRTNDTLDGYLPRNRKLYTYPFTFLHVDNGCGESLVLRYELFSGSPSLKIFGCITQPITVVLRPRNYKGSGSTTADSDTLNTEMLSLQSYPMCSWNTDAYQAWVAQNAVPILMGGVTGAVTSGVSAGVGAVGAGIALSTPIGAGLVAGAVGAQVLGSVIGAIGEGYKASIAADISRGVVASGSVNVANRTQNFYYGRASVTYQQARIIDDFFDMYGYAVNRVKVPNVTSRPQWNYIKTSGCSMVGKCPVDDIRKMCGIYDSGITFWHNPANVGKYNLNNKPS